MAERLEEFTFNGHGTSKYPWDEWLDGSPWRLDNKADFPGTTPSNFRISAHNVARKRGLKVRAQVDGEEIVIQAYKP